MITLYTPATGYPELEAKLAFGLARVGLEAGAEVHLIPEPGYYRVEFNGVSKSALCKAWETLSKRLLSSDTLYGELLPAFDRASLTTSSRRSPNAPHTAISEETLALYSTLASRSLQPFTGERRICGHDGRDVPPFGGGRLALALSSHVGVASRRDNVRSEGKMKICDYCGHLAVLGAYSFGANVALTRAGGPRLSFTLMPDDQVDTPALIEIAAAQRHWPRALARKPLPVSTIPLVFALHAKSFAHALSSGFVVHTAVYSEGGSGQPRVDATMITRIAPFLSFVQASPFNAATVAWLVSPAQPVVDSLMQLARLLSESDRRARRQLAAGFARGYVTGADPDNPRLLYPVTARYIAEELLMIPAEIVRNEAIASVASALRHFVIERNYGFVDNVRNARYDSHDLERTLAQMLRQMQVHRAAEKKGAWLPDEHQIAEVITLASASEDDFENVKLALTLLALSRWPGADSELEEPALVADVAEEAEE